VTTMHHDPTHAPDQPEAIEVTDLVVAYGEQRALDALCLTVPRGSVYGLLGANGAGKTTLIKTLLGFRRPTSGSARVLGRDVVTQRVEVSARVGYVGEENPLCDYLTIPQLCAFCRDTSRRWDQDAVDRYLQLFGSQTVDFAVVVGAADRPAVERQLAQTSGVKNEVVSAISPDTPVAVNGQPIGPIVHAAVATGRYSPSDVLGSMDGLQGHDLARGEAPDPKAFTPERGSRDRHVGRDLTAADSGTANALLPVSASQPPLNMRLGDTFTVADPSGRHQQTLTVVGFYRSTVALESIQVDAGVVSALTGGNPAYAYIGYLDPSKADATLARIQAAVPGAVTYSLADIQAQVTTVLNNVAEGLVAVASLTLLASIIIIANAVALAMLERRRELGILKAVGYTSRGVLGGVLVEQGAIGFTGGLLAMLLVAVAAPTLGSVVFGQAFAAPAPIILAVVPATAAVCMLVAFAVAWRAARVRPLEVLRYE
jgi:putative ABC transport system permease protein